MQLVCLNLLPRGYVEAAYVLKIRNRKKDCPDIIWRVICKSAADAAADSSDEDEVTVF
jgi:hypothetical protein